jgi:multicomponent K+:H+ antiporter subunit E/multicomponent Na+:H+ antiporter subunit E
MSRIAWTLGLAGVFLLTLVSDDPIDLAMGTVVGLMLATLLASRLEPARPPATASALSRLAGLPVFAAAVLLDIVTGTWDVALRVVHLRRLERPGVVRVPIGKRTERGVAISALATTLSPGTVLIDVDWDRREMLIHVIDASDPDDVRERLQAFYERYQRRVFP